MQLKLSRANSKNLHVVAPPLEGGDDDSSPVIRSFKAAQVVPIHEPRNKPWSMRALTAKIPIDKFRDELVASVVKGKKHEWETIASSPRKLFTGRLLYEMSPTHSSHGEDFKFCLATPKGATAMMINPVASPVYRARELAVESRRRWRENIAAKYGIPLEKLLGTGIKSDFVITLGSKIKMPVHRDVLSQISPSIAAYSLEKDTYMLNTGNLAGLSLVLEYIYLGRCSISIGDLPAVWTIADELGLKDIINEINAQEIRAALSSENCVALKLFAKVSNNEAIARKIKNFEDAFGTAPVRWYFQTSTASLDVVNTVARIKGELLQLEHPITKKPICAHVMAVDMPSTIELPRRIDTEIKNELNRDFKYLLDVGKSAWVCVSSKAEDATACSYAVMRKLIDASKPPENIKRYKEETYHLRMQFQEACWSRVKGFQDFLTAVRFRSEEKAPSDRELLRSGIRVQPIPLGERLAFGLKGVARYGGLTLSGTLHQILEAVRCVMDQQMRVEQSALCITTPSQIPFSVVFNCNESFIFDIAMDALFVVDDIPSIRSLLHLIADFFPLPTLRKPLGNGIVGSIEMDRPWSPRQPAPTPRGNSSYARYREHVYQQFSTHNPTEEQLKRQNSTQNFSGLDATVSSFASLSPQPSPISPRAPLSPNLNAHTSPRVAKAYVSPLPKTKKMIRNQGFFWHGDVRLVDMPSPMVQNPEHTHRFPGKERIIRDYRPQRMYTTSELI